jgi:hypothetical protein
MEKKVKQNKNNRKKIKETSPLLFSLPILFSNQLYCGYALTVRFENLDGLLMALVPLSQSQQ